MPSIADRSGGRAAARTTTLVSAVSTSVFGVPTGVVLAASTNSTRSRLAKRPGRGTTLPMGTVSEGVGGYQGPPSATLRRPFWVVLLGWSSRDMSGRRAFQSRLSHWTLSVPSVLFPRFVVSAATGVRSTVRSSPGACTVSAARDNATPAGTSSARTRPAESTGTTAVVGGFAVPA